MILTIQCEGDDRVNLYSEEDEDEEECVFSLFKVDAMLSTTTGELKSLGTILLSNSVDIIINVYERCGLWQDVAN